MQMCLLYGYLVLTGKRRNKIAKGIGHGCTFFILENLMSRLLTGKFVAKSLAATISTFMLCSVANAATAEQTQIQELRKEVEALKALIQQQQQVQLQQASQIEQVKAQPAQKYESPLASLKSKTGADVNLYGFVRADAEYQFEGGDKIFNRINDVDLTDSDKYKDRFYATAKTTRIGLDFKAPVQGADVGGKIEVDFAGTNDGVRIRHAYLTYNNWLFGQTTSSFLSTETQPEMLDFGSPLGIGTYRTPMVRYSDKINANTQYSVGLEKGNDDNRFPALTGKVGYKFADGKGTVNGRALVQEVRARPDNENLPYFDETKFGWGLAAGLRFSPVEQLTLNADYSHITGDDKFLLYTNNRFTVEDNNRELDLLDIDAFTVGATYKFNEKFRSTLGYGALYYDNAKGNQNDNLQQGWLNIMYNPVKPITFGAEYVYGERETANDQKGKDSRLGFMAKYDF